MPFWPSSHFVVVVVAFYSLLILYFVFGSVQPLYTQNSIICISEALKPYLSTSTICNGVEHTMMMRMYVILFTKINPLPPICCWLSRITMSFFYFKESNMHTQTNIYKTANHFYNVCGRLWPFLYIFSVQYSFSLPSIYPILLYVIFFFSFIFVISSFSSFTIFCYLSVSDRLRKCYRLP